MFLTVIKINLRLLFYNQAFVLLYRHKSKVRASSSNLQNLFNEFKFNKYHQQQVATLHHHQFIKIILILTLSHNKLNQSYQVYLTIWLLSQTLRTILYIWSQKQTLLHPKRNLNIAHLWVKIYISCIVPCIYLINKFFVKFQSTDNNDWK